MVMVMVIFEEVLAEETYVTLMSHRDINVVIGGSFMLTQSGCV
jgi:hypothetical protein